LLAKDAEQVRGAHEHLPGEHLCREVVRVVLMDVVQAARDLRLALRDGLREVLAHQPDQRPQVAGDDLLREVMLPRELRIDGLEDLPEGSPSVGEFDRVVELGAGSEVGPEADDLLPATQLELFRVQQAGRVDEDVEQRDVERVVARVDVGFALEEEDELEVWMGMLFKVPDATLFVETLAELQLRSVERDGLEEGEGRLR